MLELLEYFQKGGMVMYPLLACSVIALGIFIERLVYYNKALGDEAVHAKLYDYMDAGEQEAAYNIAAGGDSSVCELLQYYSGLTQERNTKIQTLETKVSMMMSMYEDKLHILNTIVTLAPLLGLLGTILGIISSFSIFSVSADQPFAITAGIGEALIATGFGIVVAVFALVLHELLELKITKLDSQIEFCALKIVESGK